MSIGSSHSNMLIIVSEQIFIYIKLPRHLKYKQENIILCGIMPGPSELSLHINSYFEPLVFKTYLNFGMELR